MPQTLKISLPPAIPKPKFQLFTWVTYSGVATTPDNVDHVFTDVGKVVGIEWDGRNWRYSVNFDAELSNENSTTIRGTETEEGFYEEELCNYAD